MATEKTTSPDPTFASREPHKQAAAAAVEQALAHIEVWCCAAKTEEPLTVKNSSALQVTSRLIEERMQELADTVDGTGSSALMFGANLVGIVESALWNLGTFEVEVAPSRDSLISTMRQAAEQFHVFLAALRAPETAEEPAHG